MSKSQAQIKCTTECKSLYLTHNSCKTEYLLIGLKKQLVKIYNFSLISDKTEFASRVGNVSQCCVDFVKAPKYCHITPISCSFH